MAVKVSNPNRQIRSIHSKAFFPSIWRPVFTIRGTFFIYIRNFPYPSVFELTGRQRLTVKRGIRNVGQFLAAEVINPGQNESQQMLALCDQMDKEGDILDGDSSPNESPDWVTEGERRRMIGQNPKNGRSTVFFSGNRDKDFSFQDGGHRERTGESHAKLLAKKQSRVLGQQLVWQDVLTLSPKLRVKKRNRALGQDIADAFKPSSTESR